MVLIVVLLAVAAALWFWRGRDEAPAAKKGAGAVPVVSAPVSRQAVAVRLTGTGTVTARQSVEVRAQISATIRTVHVREGQFVRQGDRLFSLDVRAEEANLGKAEAQLTRTRADLANAERNLLRQRELFERKFISQTALDTVQNLVDSLRAQVTADQASIAAARVTRSFGDIVAPLAGRIGAVTVYPGSLVQPGGTALLSITQMDPISVSFTQPERELPAIRQAQAAGTLAVQVRLSETDRDVLAGTLGFIDSSVDTASGTIRLKADFANADHRLWPGMFVTVALSPRTLADALTVPVQAVQTGPERKFLYTIGEEGKVSAVPVRVLLVQDGLAVIEGAEAGTRVVMEGAQNLRPGSVVREADTDAAAAGKPAGKKKP